ncbi:MAG: polymerase sigma factor SigJ [Cypionkella sp.]|uniref:sigma-70 family RNA polymerase sigma factor n=1 Tax=Cypionkella sp. TaxID=2811411 RepID=UPI00261BB40E|nr:sigma-70 family RNA polymerase sigma factor [Cypionkella sp.]MDB5658851.1 polymerase sigma factor SigJ [Cypionkella sp.]
MQPNAETFEAQRPRLLRLAYRMLGSRAEAEDVVQDAYLRWHKLDAAKIDSPAAYLSRIVTRLCLDAMKSAHAQRETYFGRWLPEPITEPKDDALRADNLTLTLMVALERLSPLERAAFLLHDVFETSVSEIAHTLNRDPEAVRQLASRARKHVQAERPRYVVGRDEGNRITHAFLAATRSGDIAALQSLLAQGVMMHSDGGGKVSAFPNVISGAANLLRLFAGLWRKHGTNESLIKLIWNDGLPGYVSTLNGVLQTTTLEIEHGQISAIYRTRNPDKLARLPLSHWASTTLARPQ